jgi:hypothetical protein
VWQREQPAPLIPLQPQQDVNRCAVSPDGRWVAASTFGGVEGFAVRVWEAHTGQLVKALPSRWGGAAFSPDGRWLLTASPARLWRVGTWEEGPTVGGSWGCFAPDGRSLAAEGDGGAVRLVEADSGAEVVRLEGLVHTRVLPLCFSPDGTRLVAVAAGTGTLIVWDLRALRQDLRPLGLDWDAPPYPPPAEGGPVRRLDVEVVLGNLPHRAEADRLVAQARGQLGSGQAAEAAATLRQAVKADPTHAEAANELAWLLLAGPASLRHAEEALPLARKAAELAPEEPLYLNTLGLALYRADRTAEAVPVLEKSLAAGRGQNDACNLFILAMCHAKLGKPAEARDCFDRAVKWVEGKNDLLPRSAGELKAFRAEAEAELRAP